MPPEGAQAYDSLVILQIVALPLGNPADISRRAQDCLMKASVIVCEDTRKVKHLLSSLGVSSGAQLFAASAGRSTEIDWSRWCEQHKGQQVVLVSDAGTPLINDPGHQLLQAAKALGWTVEALPGPCAPILAYQLTGGFGLPIIFAGFPPKKRIREFFEAHRSAGTLIFFETKHQYAKTFQELIKLGWQDRKVFVAREMTKTHEEVIECSVGECAAILEARQKREGGALGELTVVLELIPSGVEPAPGLELEDLLTLRTAAPKDAAKLMAKLLNLPTQEVYQKIVTWKE